MIDDDYRWNDDDDRMNEWWLMNGMNGMEWMNGSNEWND